MFIPSGGGWSSGGVAVAADSAGSAVAAAVSAVAARDRAGDQMRTKEFLSKLEHDRIIQAIRDAESKTSGEIRVLIQRGKLKSDPLDGCAEEVSSARYGQDARAQCGAHFRRAACSKICGGWGQGDS